MTTIATLSLRFEADTRPMDRALKQSQTATRRFQRAASRSFTKLRGSIGRAAKAMFSFRGAMVAVAGIAGIGLLVKRSLEAADKIAKTADAIGITTDALQEYRFAAGLAGVSTGQLDSAIGAFVKRVGEAKLTGKGTLTEFLKDSNDELLKMLTTASTSEEALGIFLRALAEVDDQAEKVALSAAAFGRTAGLGMTVLVKQGADAIEEMRQRARDLDIVLGEDLLRSAEKANDKLSELGQVLSAVVNRAILENADSITQLAAALIDAIPKLTQFVEEFAVWVGLLDQRPSMRLAEINEELKKLAVSAPSAGIMASVIDFLQELRSGETFRGSTVNKLLEERARLIEILLEKEREAERVQARRGARVTTVRGAPGLVTVPTIDPKEMLAQQKAILTEIQTPMEKFSERVQFLNARVEEGTITWDQYNRALEIARGRFSEASGAAAAIADKLAQQREIIATIQTPLEKYQERIEFLKEKVAEGTITWEQHNRAVVIAGERMREATEAGKTGLDKVNEAMAIGKRLADHMGQSFDSAFSRAISGASDFRSIMLALVNDIQRALMSELTGGKGVGGLLVSALSGIFPGGDSFTKGLVASEGFGFRHGGSFTVGGSGGPDSQHVGLNLTPGERVTVETPAQQQAGAAAHGGQVTIQMYIATGVVPAVRQEVMALMPAIVSRVKSALAASQTRTGG